MKTANSVADALRGYLRKRRETQITEQLNQAYATGPSQDERRLTRKLKAKLPVRGKW